MTKKSKLSKNADHTQDSLTTSIMERIESGDLSMRPGWHFMALTALLVATTAVLALLFALAVLAIFQDVQLAREWQLFNTRGDVLTRFPWRLVLLASMLIAGLYWIIRKFNFSYQVKRNIFLSMFGAGLVLVVLMVALLPGLNGIQDRKPLRSLTGFQRSIEQKRLSGAVQSFDGEVLLLETDDGKSVELMLSSRLRGREFLERAAEGQGIEVLVSYDQEAIHVEAVKPFRSVKGVQIKRLGR